MTIRPAKQNGSAALLAAYNEKRERYQHARHSRSLAEKRVAERRAVLEAAGAALILDEQYKFLLGTVDNWETDCRLLRQQAIGLGLRARSAWQVEFAEANNRIDLENFPPLGLAPLDE